MPPIRAALNASDVADAAALFRFATCRSLLRSSVVRGLRSSFSLFLIAATADALSVPRVGPQTPLSRDRSPWGGCTTTLGYVAGEATGLRSLSTAPAGN